MIAPLRKQNNLTKLKTTQRKSPTVRPYIIFSLPSYDTEKKKSVRKRDSYCTDMILDMYNSIQARVVLKTGVLAIFPRIFAFFAL